MNILKYTNKSCTKDKILDNSLCQVNLPCSITVLYVEEYGEDYFVRNGINHIPTLHIVGDTQDVKIWEDFSPSYIQSVIDTLE